MNELNKIPKWIYITLSICVFLFIVAYSFIWNLQKFEELSKESLKFLNKSHGENIELITSHASDSLTVQQKDILLRKISILEQDKAYHIDSIIKLSKNKYALLTLFPFLSAITAILAFLIVQKSWNSSNEYLKTYFILFATLTSLAGIYPEVYKQSYSIEKHRENYISYKKIQKEIFNYALTYPVSGKRSTTFKQFINQINIQEKELIDLIFDIEKKSLGKDILDSQIIN